MDRYTDGEIQDLAICHRGACHDHKGECENCNLHFEVVCDLFQRHCLQYTQACPYEVQQVFRIDNKKLKKKFRDRQTEMRKKATVLTITNCGVNQVNGEYRRDDTRSEIFTKLAHTQWGQDRNGNAIKKEDWIVVYRDQKKNRSNKQLWRIKAVQLTKSVLSLPQTEQTKLLYHAHSNSEEVPPLQGWHADSGVKGPVPSIRIHSKKVVVHNNSDLESAMRNYFREYFFRHSLDGRNISNLEIMDHISNTMTGKPAPRKPGLQERKVSWDALMKELKVDINKNATPLKNFMQKQSDAASIRWAWHGTKAENIKSIASKNFRSSFCKRQVHGKGHYFSPDPDLALRYAPDSFGQDGNAYKCLILCQTLLGNTAASRSPNGDSNTHKDFCYVIPDERQIWPVYVVVVRV